MLVRERKGVYQGYQKSYDRATSPEPQANHVVSKLHYENHLLLGLFWYNTPSALAYITLLR